MSTALFDRRSALAFGLATGASATMASAASKPAAHAASAVPANTFGLDPSNPKDQSEALQAAIDQTTSQGLALALPPGRIVVGDITLRPGTRLLGAPGFSILVYRGRGDFISGVNVPHAHIEGVTLDGGLLPLDLARTKALLSLTECSHMVLQDIRIQNSAQHGIMLTAVSGRVSACTVAMVKGAGLFSIDAGGLDISHNTVADCQDNGILVWRSKHGEDGTIVSHNRIMRVGNASGGTGQYGNGINIFRAANVLVTNNRISQCAYTAIRANEASNVQMIANSADKSGEVALYAEAAAERDGAPGFEGAIISSNMIDGAASGIVVTNFNNGGRLAVVQGNVIRNLYRREQESRDKRGEGIAVEADAVVANNVIESAPTAGIMVGWGKYMREVIVTGNLIRKARIGIALSGDPAAGQCLIANNMISGAVDGAIRAMDHARAVGADLSAGGKAPRRVQLNGNIAS
jgi:uncharacterized secreted repeat protein (TIGR03808 family)